VYCNKSQCNFGPFSLLQDVQWYNIQEKLKDLLPSTYQKNVNHHVGGKAIAKRFPFPLH